jgi:hypothetical protein
MWAVDSAFGCLQVPATMFDAKFVPRHIPHQEPFPLVSPSSLLPSSAPELGPARPTSAPGLNLARPRNSGTGPGLAPPMSALGLGSSPTTSNHPRPTPFLSSPALRLSVRLGVQDWYDRPCPPTFSCERTAHTPAKFDCMASSCAGRAADG